MKKRIWHNRPALTTLALALGILGADITNDAQAGSSNGLCISDISLKWTNRLNDYAYDSSQTGNSANGINFDVPVMQWDSYKADLLNISYRLEDFSSGNCLDAVAIIGGRYGNASIPTSNRSGIWKKLGSWYSSYIQGLNVPSNADLAPGNDYLAPAAIDNGGQGVLTGTLMTRKATYSDMSKQHSGWIVTHLDGAQDNCPTKWPQVYCAGIWRDQQYNAKYLVVYLEPYADFAKNGVSSLTGRWNQLSNCSGCSTTTFSYTEGVVDGKTTTKGTETSRSLAVTLGVEKETSAPVVGKFKAKMEITGTLTDSRSQSIADSFETQKSKTLEQTCEKGRLYQWQSTLALENGNNSTANSDLFVCTSNDDFPPDPRNIAWNGCVTEQFFPSVSFDGGQVSGVNYRASSAWRCKQ